MDQNDKMNFLAQSIKNARKVMEKVETHNVTGNGFTHSNASDFISEAQMIQRKNSTMKNMSTSKMPAAILKSFQENPIIDPTAPIGMESMMQEITKKASPVERIEENTTNKGGYVVESQQTAPVMDTKLIEYIIKKTVEETIDQINKKTSIDENIQIKIGDKTFGGKLSTLKEVKK
jgi:hypothetical protein